MYVFVSLLSIALYVPIGGQAGSGSKRVYRLLLSAIGCQDKVPNLCMVYYYQQYYMCPKAESRIKLQTYVLFIIISRIICAHRLSKRSGSKLMYFCIIFCSIICAHGLLSWIMFQTYVLFINISSIICPHRMPSRIKFQTYELFIIDYYH